MKDMEQGTIVLDFDADLKLFGIEVMFAEWVLSEQPLKDALAICTPTRMPIEH